jgi:hypothetical protein
VGNYLQLTPDGVTDWSPDNDLTADHHYDYNIMFTKNGGTVEPPPNIHDYGWIQKSCWLGQQYNFAYRDDNSMLHQMAFMEMGLYIRSWQLKNVQTIQQVTVDWGTKDANIYNGYHPNFNNQFTSQNTDPSALGPFCEFSCACLGESWTTGGAGWIFDAYGTRPSEQDKWYRDGFRSTVASSSTKYHQSNDDNTTTLNYWDILAGRGVQKKSVVPDGIRPPDTPPTGWTDDCSSPTTVAWKHICFNDHPTIGDDNPAYFYVQFNYCFKGIQIGDGNDNYYQYDKTKMHYHDVLPPP